MMPVFVVDFIHRTIFPIHKTLGINIQRVVYIVENDYHNFIYKLKISAMCQVKFSQITLTLVLFRRLNGEQRTRNK